MVALAILATAFAAVLRLHSDSIDMLISSRIRTTAAQLAQYKMTQIEALGLENLSMMSGEFEALAPDYKWEIQVEPTGMKDWSKVTVTVTNRLIRRGGEYELTEFMILGKPDLQPLRPPVPPGRRAVPARRGA
jgi:hypothetical protein